MCYTQPGAPAPILSYAVLNSAPARPPGNNGRDNAARNVRQNAGPVSRSGKSKRGKYRGRTREERSPRSLAEGPAAAGRDTARSINSAPKEHVPFKVKTPHDPFKVPPSPRPFSPPIVADPARKRGYPSIRRRVPIANEKSCSVAFNSMCRATRAMISTRSINRVSCARISIPDCLVDQHLYLCFRLPLKAGQFSPEDFICVFISSQRA